MFYHDANTPWVVSLGNEETSLRNESLGKLHGSQTLAASTCMAYNPP